MQSHPLVPGYLVEVPDAGSEDGFLSVVSRLGMMFQSLRPNQLDAASGCTDVLGGELSKDE